MADRHPRPDRCRDTDCGRLACTWYRNGFEDGVGAGFAAGQQAAQAGCNCG